MHLRLRTLLLLLSIMLNSCAQKKPNYEGFASVQHQAENTTFQGRWRISALLSYSGTKEYFLYPPSTEPYGNYGNNVSFTADQSFVSAYSAECGNDCFTTTKGKYKIIDDHYICFYVAEITHRGECSGDSKPNEDLGKYYYYKVDAGYRLVKSAGSLEADQKNVTYYDLVTTKRKEIEQFYYRDGQNQALYNWKPTNTQEEKDIVAACMNDKGIKDYELLYSYTGNEYSRLTIILVKANNQLRYVLYDTWGQPMVSLYDDSEVSAIDAVVDSINKDTSLVTSVKKKKTVIESNTQSQIITVYKKNNEICKAVYANYYEYGERISINNITIYWQKGVPIYIDYLSSPDREPEASETGFYILDWENNRDACRFLKTYSGRNSKRLVIEKPYLTKIIQEITTGN